MKPPLAFLRQCGHIICGYIDDLYLQGKIQQKCIANVIAPIRPLVSLKTLSLSNPWWGQSYWSPNFQFTRYQIWSPVLQKFRNDKVSALKLAKGSFKENMCISHKGLSELHWRLCNLDSSFNTICCPPVEVTLYSDASLQGCGAVMNNTSTGGMWLPTESRHHINYLELLAAFFALQCFHSSLSDKHVKIVIDNTSAVSQINNMGICLSEECDSLVVQIWEFCISHNICWLTAAHIPGSSNEILGGESSHFHSQDTEWMLNPEILTKALKTLNFSPEIDLFASWLNKQLPIFCSFRPDPGASFINAFIISWSDNKTLLFSPFQLYLTGATENHSGSGNLCASGSWLAHSSMVPSADITQNLTIALDFLTMLHENRMSYSTVNTARSMLSSILQLNTNSSLPIGQLPIVKRFMKGIYDLRPSLPRYTTMWDLSIVLSYFRKGASVSELSLKELTLKLTFLLTLLSEQRCQIDSQILFSLKIWSSQTTNVPL